MAGNVRSSEKLDDIGLAAPVAAKNCGLLESRQGEARCAVAAVQRSWLEGSGASFYMAEFSNLPTTLCKATSAFHQCPLSILSHLICTTFFAGQVG